MHESFCGAAGAWVAVRMCSDLYRLARDKCRVLESNARLKDSAALQKTLEQEAATISTSLRVRPHGLPLAPICSTYLPLEGDSSLRKRSSLAPGVTRRVRWGGAQALAGQLEADQEELTFVREEVRKTQWKKA